MEYFNSQRDTFLDFIKDIVTFETPSDSRNDINKLVTFLEEKFQEIGCQSQILDGRPHGDHLLVSCGEGQEKILLLCHMDTVWRAGTLEKMPFKIEGNKASGPGIFDMKAGIAFLWFVFKAFVDLEQKPDKEILALITSDEESGSETAKKYITEYAKDCKAVLVIEPAGEGGALKTFRKGLGMVNVKIKGKAAHAGLDHKNGISAIKELAELILKAESLTDYSKGTTVNVGLVRGGTVSNVVAAEAYAEIDFRFSEPIEGEKIDQFFKNYMPSVQGVKVEFSGGLDRMPLMRTPEVVSLFEKAKECAKELKLDIEEIAVGGVSDGNFTSAIGIPTLDGLGAIGGGAHAEDEHILIDETMQRVILLYKLLFKV